MALIGAYIVALISSMRNLALFVFIGCLVVSVSASKGGCPRGPSVCEGDWLCCGNVDCVLKSCVNHFCRQDQDCSNYKDKLICCENKCVLESRCVKTVNVGQSCSSDSDCLVNQKCCDSKCAPGKSCVGERCVFDSDCSVNQACCHSTCVQGKDCAGKRCYFDSDCSVNQACCNSKCVPGKSCLGHTCDFHSDCSSGQSCCNNKCKSGSTCIGESCSSDSHCQDIGAKCCAGTCSKGDCDNSDLIAYIAGPVAGFVIIFIILIIFVHRRRLMAENITTREDNTVLTEEITTSISGAPVTYSNPLYQPQGPPSDQQPRQQPHQYTAEPRRRSDYAHLEPCNAAPRKSAGVV